MPALSLLNQKVFTMYRKRQNKYKYFFGFCNKKKKTKELKKMKKVNELYDLLIENEYFTSDELQLLTNINGYSIETLNDAIYARYGYRDYEQMKESE